MASGRFSHLVSFQKRTLTASGEQFIETWPIGFQEWVEPQRQTEIACRFIMQYRKAPDGSEITPNSHRIIWKEIIWNITDIVPEDHKERLLIIDCDFSEAIEVTHFQSLVREYIHGLTVLRPRE